MLHQGVIGAAEFRPGVFNHIFSVIGIKRRDIAVKQIIEIAADGITVDIELSVLFNDNIRIAGVFKILDKVVNILRYFFRSRAVEIIYFQNIRGDISACNGVTALVYKICKYFFRYSA